MYKYLFSSSTVFEPLRRINGKKPQREATAADERHMSGCFLAALLFIANLLHVVRTAGVQHHGVENKVVPTCLTAPACNAESSACHSRLSSHLWG